MQTEKTVVITGGNSGIGKQTAITFATNGYNVVITSRSDEKGTAAVKDITRQSNNPRVSHITGNLSTIADCRSLANKIVNRTPAIDLLINNAGVTTTEKEMNTDGLEMSFMVNALAPYILTKGLINSLIKSIHPQVLNVTTGEAFLKMAKFDPDKSPYGLDYTKGLSYAISKLAGVILMLIQVDEIKNHNISLNAFSPGIYKTANSMKDMNDPALNQMRDAIMLHSMPLEVAGEAPYLIATDTNLRNTTGSFFNRNEKAVFPPQLYDRKIRERLTEKIGEWQL